jgi:hypothetical protein
MKIIVLLFFALLINSISCTNCGIVYSVSCQAFCTGSLTRGCRYLASTNKAQCGQPGSCCNEIQQTECNGIITTFKIDYPNTSFLCSCNNGNAYVCFLGDDPQITSSCSFTPL